MEKVNFREIAKELNISHMTLYRVINKAPNVRAVTRNRVIDALNRHGYHSSSLVGEQTVLFDLDANSKSNYMRNIVSGIMKRLSSQSFRCMITYHGVDRYHFLMECRKADIVVFAPMNGDEIYREVKEVNPDILVLNLLDDMTGDIVINTNDFLGGELAARHLLERGHCEHVLMVRHIAENGLHHSFRTRCKSFLAEMLISNPKCRIDILEMSLTEPEKYYRDFARFFRKGKSHPTAIFCPGRFFADQITEFCKRKEPSIPDDVSLIGFDKPKDSESPVYDRIVFNPEQIINWAEYFITTRPVIKSDSPFHLLLDMALEDHKTTQIIQRKGRKT